MWSVFPLSLLVPAPGSSGGARRCLLSAALVVSPSARSSLSSDPSRPLSLSIFSPGQVVFFAAEGIYRYGIVGTNCSVQAVVSCVGRSGEMCVRVLRVIDWSNGVLIKDVLVCCAVWMDAVAVGIRT